MDLIKLIDAKDLISFSQNFSVTRNYLGDRLFPDIKTQHLKAEFLRLSDSRNLPTMAFVHSLDSEAHIGQRPKLEKVQMEKMLIKEKINQSEKVQLFLENGGTDDGVVRYVFDDVARLSESVKTRTEVMKCELLSTGKVTVKENDLNLSVDYGVPAGNASTMSFAAGADILGEIQTAVDNAADAGQPITHVVTSSKVMTALRKNTGIQKAIGGANNAGVFVSNAQLNALIFEMFGFTLETYDARYQYEKKTGVLATKRYIDDDKFIMMNTLANNSIGSGLWGVTPEEAAQGAWTSKSATQFITSVMWQEPDPVAVWTKASGLFIPALPNPKGLFIKTITF